MSDANALTEVRLAKIRPFEFRLEEVRPAEIRLAEVRQAEIRLAEVRLVEVCLEEFRLNPNGKWRSTLPLKKGGLSRARDGTAFRREPIRAQPDDCQGTG